MASLNYHGKLGVMVIIVKFVLFPRKLKILYNVASSRTKISRKATWTCTKYIHDLNR